MRYAYNKQNWSQKLISELTKMEQGAVSEIINGLK